MTWKGLRDLRGRTLRNYEPSVPKADGRNEKNKKKLIFI